MPVFISLKKSIVFLICGIVCAAGTAFLVNYFLSGPRLGPVYDFFLSRRQPPPVSREIFLIKTDEFVESSDVFSVLMTLTEMEAANLILSAKISGSASPVTGSEAEIRLRFQDEFAILGANIRNMFEAIRLGSIPPSQAPFYVERLVELSQQSRDRLLSGLIDRDEDLIRSIAVFGNFLEEETLYSFDRDGKLRRVQPVELESSLEHPVYRVLKLRYAVSRIEETENGRILLLRGFNDSEAEIQLDRNGNIITAFPAAGFRGVDISLFREYEEALNVMRRILKEADEMGIFSKTLPENSPLFLNDYSLDLREELLKEPDNEKKTAWISANDSFFRSLDDFLYGPSEMLLVRGYEEIIADEDSPTEEVFANLIKMRGDMIGMFALMREKHNELLWLRDILKNELSSSFCIMGARENIEYSALLANALITGSHVKPADSRYALYWSIAACLVILLAIFRLRPFFLLAAGLFSSFLASAAFGVYFIFSAYWIDPFIVFGAALAGTLVVFSCKCVTILRRMSVFRRAYGAAVSGDALKKLIIRGKPEPSEITVANAAVVAIKDINLFSAEENVKPMDLSGAQKTFYSDVKKAVFGAGAVIAGYERDTVIACFGSPLGGKTGDPAEKAYAMIRGFLDKETPWRFGMDAGECSFSWSPETGFTANGRPVINAKILVSKAARLKTRALVSKTAREDS
jgi:hypothetical protein